MCSADDSVPRMWPCRGNAARVVAGFAERGLQALARHFEQAEARDLAGLHAGAVMMQRVLQTIFDIALVFRVFHVDEIDHDQAAEVAQPHLAGDFISRFEVGIGGGVLDVAALVARAELTSTDTSASVWSITIAPPDGRLTWREYADSIWCSIWKRENSGTSSCKA